MFFVFSSQALLISIVSRSRRTCLMYLLPGSQRYKERMKQKWALREEYKLVFPTKQKKKNGVEHIPAGEGLVSETNE